MLSHHGKAKVVPDLPLLLGLCIFIHRGPRRRRLGYADGQLAHLPIPQISPLPQKLDHKVFGLSPSGLDAGRRHLGHRAQGIHCGLPDLLALVLETGSDAENTRLPALS
eukprot:scaffold167_cov244-Pinguiococcus_pyrenoidosus.AAC.10